MREKQQNLKVPGAGEQLKINNHERSAMLMSAFFNGFLNKN